MPVHHIPHASWADVYDLAYEHSFGLFYSELTQTTIQLITETLHTGGSILDFGAGTGRLSIPLAEKHFDVTAVDPCQEMLDQLALKKSKGMKIHTVCSTMQDFKGCNFDFALCVFTVLLYVLDENALNKALSAAYSALKPEGRLLIDIPSRGIFQGYSTNDERMSRRVSVTPDNEDVYWYEEKLIVNRPGNDAMICSDRFRIRYWPDEVIRNALLSVGFILQADLTHHFYGAGSQYWILKKIS
ncbi:MAG: class I SAM-dependent methyltransferase [Methylococcaceae bacterium]